MDSVGYIWNLKSLMEIMSLHWRKLAAQACDSRKQFGKPNPSSGQVRGQILGGAPEQEGRAEEGSGQLHPRKDGRCSLRRQEQKLGEEDFFFGELSFPLRAP